VTGWLAGSRIGLRGRWRGTRTRRINQVQAELGGVMPATTLLVTGARDEPALRAIRDASTRAAREPGR